MYRNILRTAVATSFLVGAGITTAQATVIGALPGTDFSQEPTSFTFGSDSVQHALSQQLQTPAFGPAGGVTEAVATTGRARVAGSTINDDEAAGFAEGVMLGPDQSVDNAYVAFADPASATLDEQTPYLGLQFDLDDGVHYGYAEADGSLLTRFAYESEANAPIATGASIEQAIAPGGNANDVPAPSGFAIFGVALGLLGVGGLRRYTQNGHSTAV